MTRRRLIIASIIAAAALLLGLAEGIRRYASSQLVGGLARLYGGRVEAERARAGWTRVGLDQVRFFDKDQKEVVLFVDRMEMNLTLWDLISGRTTPSHLSLYGPTVTLRFDEAGKLLTKVPTTSKTGGFPQRIDVERGSLVIDQQGRNPTQIDGASAHITSDQTRLTLTGSLANSRWGNWELGGQASTSFRDGTFTASTTALHVTPNWLRGLPLVPPDLWKQLVADGNANVRAEFQLDPPAGKPAVHADIELDHALVTLPALDVQVNETGARLSIDDTAAILHTARGAMAGGDVEASGQVDLSAVPIKSSINVSLQKVNVAKLPASWSVPAEADGLVSGAAKLDLSLDNAGAMAIGGEGRATVSDAKIAGVPIEPIAMELRGRDELQPGGKQSLSGHVAFDVKLRDAPLKPLLKPVIKSTDDDLADMDGRITTDVHVELPLATFKDLATYRVQGSLRDSTLSFRGLELQDVRAIVDLAGGVFRLNNLEADIPGEAGAKPGHVSGSLEATIAGDGAVSLQLSAKDAPLALLRKLTDSDVIPIGSASLNFKASVPLDKIREPSAWQATGDVRLPSVAVEQRAVNNVSANFAAEQGVLHISDARATVADAQVTGSAEVHLEDPYRYSAAFQVQNGELATLAEFAGVNPPEPIAGRLQAAGNAQGTLSPFTWETSGTASAEPFSIGTWAVSHASLRFQATQDRIRLTQLNATAWGGRVNGEMNVSLDNAQPPTIEAEFSDIHLEQLPRQVLELVPGLKGTVSGSLSLSGSQLEKLSGEIRAESPQITLEGVEASQIRAHATLREGAVQYEVDGDVFEGQLSAKGQLNLGDQLRQRVAGTGRLTLKRVNLARAAGRLLPGHNLPLEGLLDLELDYSQQNPHAMPTGKGRLIVTNLRWGSREVAGLVESDVVLADGALQLGEISAQLGGGLLRGSATVGLDSNTTGGFNLTLERVPAPFLLAAWPALARDIEGAVDANLRGSLGRRITGGGAIAMPQARISGVEVSNLRLPVQFLFTPDSGRGEVQIQDATAAAAQGRINGSVNAVWDRVLSIAGKSQLAGMEMRSLAHSAGSFGVGSGRVSGRVDFSASDFRSLSDLTATYDLKLAQTQASQMPVLSSLARYTLPVSPSSTSFSQGELRGRMAGGVAHIQRFTLTGTDTRIMADGTMTLSGRLDLNVVAQTGGNPLSRGLIRRVVLPIIEAETVPLTLLTRANSLLADQLVYLRVGGTVHSPTIQVRPGPQLEYEAVRFFAYGLVGAVP